MAITIDSFLGVNQQTDSYTLVLLDAWQIVEINKATATNLTVPPNSEVAFPVNTRIWVKRTGAGVVTIVQGSGVTVTGSSGVLTDAGLNVEMCLRKTGTDTWDLQNGRANTPIAWTPTFTGFSVNPTIDYAEYTTDGEICTIWMNLSANGTSNLATFTLTLPFTVEKTCFWILPVTNNGTQTTGRASISAGTNVLTLGATAAGGGGFTTSGEKGVRFAGLQFRIQ